MADSYVCSGATMKCTMGTSTAKLTVLPIRTVFLTGQPMANISDHLTMVNLAPFGRCRSLGFPATAAATAAHRGHLTPMPCMHNTPFPWMGGKMDYIVKGDPALLKSCTCQCMWGGTISLITDGQVREGTQWVQKKPAEKWLMPDAIFKKYSINGNEVNDNDGYHTGDVEYADTVNAGQTSKSMTTSKTTSTIKPLSYYKAWLSAMSIDEQIAFAQAYRQTPIDLSAAERTARVESFFQDAPSSLSKIDKLRFANNCLKLEKALGITKGNKMTIAEADKQKANPKHSYKYIVDPNGTEIIDGVKCRKNPDYDEQYSINCATCSAAYALRLRGFDVKAKGNIPNTLNNWLSQSHSFDIWNNPDGTKATPSTTQDWMKKNKITKMTADGYRKYFNETCKEKGVYIITVGWKEDGGHATILQRDSDGKLYYIEPQVYNGKSTDGRRSINDLLLDSEGNLKLTTNPSDKKGIMRVDDKMLNPKYASLFDK